MTELPELPKGAACVKSSEWDDARERRQSFNGWRVRYGDCDMELFTADQLRTYAEEAVRRERERWVAAMGVTLEPMPADIAKIVSDNAWGLYSRSEQGKEQG